MELREVARVVRAHWVISTIGLVLAIGLSYLTYESRPPTPFTSTATLFVTQAGFPFSSSTSSGSGVDPGQLSTFAYLYAQIAQSDSIRRQIGAPPRSITASVITSGAFGSGSPLPFIQLTGSAPTAQGAKTYALEATTALQRYIRAGQAATNTPLPERVELETITAPPLGQPTASRRRVVILPGVVFLTVILATLGLIFMLENAGRRRVESSVEVVPAPSAQRGRWAQGAIGAEQQDQLEQAPARGGFLRRQ